MFSKATSIAKEEKKHLPVTNFFHLVIVLIHIYFEK